MLSRFFTAISPSRPWGRNVLLLAVLASFFNILPRLLAPPGSDVLIHYSLIECFARQFWQGDLYPRWCMEANSGLGGYDFLFYFPAPYYIAALFYPFHAIGLSIENIYLLCLFLAGVVTFITCWLWLSDVVGSEKALVAAFFFLWLPYRLELLYYRSAYAEIWIMALLPLFFLWLRRLASRRTKDWLTLSAIIAVGLLTHVPTMLIALGVGGVYYLLMAPDRRMLLYFAAAVVLAIAFCSIYIFPARHFLSVLNPAALHQAMQAWANGFLGLSNVRQQMPAAIAAAIETAAIIGLIIVALRRRRAIADGFPRRETMVWAAMAGVMIIMLFSISAPLWAVAKMIVGAAAMPWRVRCLLALALIFLCAVCSPWLRLKRNDYVLLWLLLVMLSLFLRMSIGDPKIIAVLEKIHMTCNGRYDQAHWCGAMDGLTKSLSEVTKADISPRVDIIKGKGTAALRQWNDEGIDMDVTMAQNGVVRLRQFYFPIWHARMEGGGEAAVAPDADTGRILLSVPEGHHDIRLYVSIAEAWPFYRVAQAMSLGAALVFLIGYGRRLPLL